MLRAPELAAAARHTLGALSVGELDPQKVFAWRDVVAERDDSSQVEWLEAQGASLVRGDAVVTEPGALHVDGRELRYDRLVIATGSSPVVPPIDGLDAVDYWTNIEATETTRGPRPPARARRRPGRLRARAVLPAHRLAGDARPGRRSAPRRGSMPTPRLSSKRRCAKTVSTSASRCAGGARHRRRLTLADGARAAVRPAPASRPGASRTSTASSRSGSRSSARDRGGRADARRAGIWALGDVTGIAPFTHVGKYHARIAAYDMVGRDVRADHRAIPATIFTDPQVATVGDTEGGVSSTWELTSVPRLSTYERPEAARASSRSSPIRNAAC